MTPIQSPVGAIINAGIAIIGVVLTVVGLGLVTKLAVDRFSDDPPPFKEWVLPALFEGGQATFAVGCAFWDVPSGEPYTDEWPDEEDAAIVVGDMEGNGGLRVLALVDGPSGHTFLSGQDCAVSVDWTLIPYPDAEERPAPSDLE